MRNELPRGSAVAAICLLLVSCASNDQAGVGGSSTGSTTASAGGATASDTTTGATSSTSATAATSTASSTGSSSSSTGPGAVCGNGIIEPGETCEGTDFGGKTCDSYGLGSGTLVCNTFCDTVLTGCTPKESCANMIDDDLDGLYDCDDPDCATSPVCISSCFTSTFVAVPSSNPGSNTGYPNTLVASCAPTAGREIVYQFTAPATETLRAEVTFASFDAALSIRTTCDDAATEVACSSQGPMAHERILFSATAGQTYYAIVESVTNDVGAYTLELAEVGPEMSCDDFVDDDFDGYVDCDDPTACQGSALCIPGTGPVGSPCNDNPDCAATNGDPVCLQAFLNYANGYCSEFCDLTNNDCPGDAQCVQLGFSHDGVCLDGCNTAADCRPGYACLDYGKPKKVCDRQPEIACDDGKDNDSDGFIDCEDPTACFTSPACVSGPGAVGTPCQLHNQCHANNHDPYCIDQFTYSWPGGYCSEFCNMANDDCASGSVCSTWLPFMSGNGLCFKTCTMTPDCPLGYQCTSDGTNMICVL